MKKITVFLGPAMSGKSKLAQQIFDTYYQGEAVKIQGKNFNPVNRFNFHQCSEITSLVIVDELCRPKDIEAFEKFFKHGLVVERKKDSTITIFPTIILIFQSEIVLEHFIASKSFKKIGLPAFRGLGMKNFDKNFDVIQFPVSPPIAAKLFNQFKKTRS